MASIKITNLRLKTIIGTNKWERKRKQRVVINISFDLKAKNASKTDNLNDSVNYKTLTKQIISFVKQSKYFLLEKLACEILKIVMTDKQIRYAEVTVDKPKALRYADSVSITLNSKKDL
ncbi:dihydroneopterin aldolase [Candidatus Margulisiibacteriota bacterium]